MLVGKDPIVLHLNEWLYKCVISIMHLFDSFDLIDSFHKILI